MPQHIYIIEHLEPQLWDWCVIEYKHISKTVGKGNVWFTNIQKKDVKTLEPYGKVFTASVKTMQLAKAAVLDPDAKELLTPQSASSASYFIFGGILGDNPPRKRTGPELTSFLPSAKSYNIGKAQMSTDNAAYVVHAIANGKPFEKIKFQDEIEIDIDEIESTILPYRYALVDGKPFISKELVTFLKKQSR